jgi:nucleotide-binding universal stress UspA family protein
VAERVPGRTPSEPASVIVAYDGSDDARSAIARAGAILAPHRVVVLSVWESVRGTALAGRLALSDDLIEAGTMRLDAEAERAAQQLAEDGALLAREAGVDATPAIARAVGSVASTIAGVADEHGAAGIVVGSRGRSEVRSLMLGSVSYQLLHVTRRAVLVAGAPRDAGSTPPGGPVLLCYDGSSTSGLAIERAGELMAGGPALVACYWEPPVRGATLASAAHPALVADLEELITELETRGAELAREVADDGAERARVAGFDPEPVALAGRGSPSSALLAFARERGALAIVVGSRGRARVKSLVLGSVSHAIVYGADVPVLVSPPA